MSIQNVVPTHPVDFETFHEICENSDLMVALEGKSGAHQSHPNSPYLHHGYLYQISVKISH